MATFKSHVVRIIMNMVRTTGCGYLPRTSSKVFLKPNSGLNADCTPYSSVVRVPKSRTFVHFEARVGTQAGYRKKNQPRERRILVQYAVCSTHPGYSLRRTATLEWGALFRPLFNM